MKDSITRIVANALSAIAISAIALTASPSGAHAQSARPVSVVDDMADVPARLAVRELLESAPARGIPLEPLLTKVREGVAKSSTPERIHDAVRLLSGRLETARAALAPVYSVAELTAGAGALQVGVSIPALKELRALAPDDPLTVPLGVLTEMIADGVPARMASTQIARLVKRRASSAMLIELGARVRADVASGIEARTALDQGSKRILSLLADPNIRTTVQPTAPPLRPPRR